MRIDDPEDPRLQRMHAERLVQRDIDQLLGICEFALQDGCIDQTEAETILAWLNSRKACLDTWPASVLYDRLRVMLRDGVLDDDEQRDLLGLVMSIARPPSAAGTVAPSSLPINNPPPTIIIPERSFCFTGVFDFGTRAECQSAIQQLGGVISNGVTKKLHYLVIGNVGSEVWKHTSFGLKIAKAVDYRENGAPLVIVSEGHWVAHLR